MKHLMFVTACFFFLLCPSAFGNGKNGNEAIIKTVKDTYLSWIDRDYQQWRMHSDANTPSAISFDNPLDFQASQRGGLSIGSLIRTARNDAGKENFSDFDIRICENQAVAEFTLNGIKKSAFLEKQQGKWKMVSVADLNPGLCYPDQILSKLGDISGFYYLDMESLQEEYSWTVKSLEMGISKIDGGISLDCRYSVATASGDIIFPVHHMDLLINTQNSQICHLGSVQWSNEAHFVHSGTSRLCKDGSLISECTFHNDDGKSFRQVLRPKGTGAVMLEIYEFDAQNRPVLMMKATLVNERHSATRSNPEEGAIQKLN